MNRRSVFVSAITVAAGMLLTFATVQPVKADVLPLSSMLTTPSPEMLYGGFASTDANRNRNFPELYVEATALRDSMGPWVFEWRGIADADRRELDARLPFPVEGASRTLVNNSGLLVVTELTRTGEGAVWAGHTIEELLAGPVALLRATFENGVGAFTASGPGFEPVSRSNIRLAADPNCHRAECFTGQLVYTAAELALCGLLPTKSVPKVLCATAIQGLSMQADNGCRKVIEICDGKDAGAFNTITSAGCSSAHSCSFTASVSDKSTLQSVDGYYIYHIGGYIAYELEFIHSGSVRTNLLTTTVNGYKVYSVDAAYTGSDPESRAFKCSTYLTVDAVAFFSSGRQPRALYMVNKPSTFRTQEECGRSDLA